MIKCNGWDGEKRCGKPAKYFASIHDAHGNSFWCEEQKLESLKDLEKE
jgi:hypothetical protein